MARSVLQALELGAVEVFCENRLVHWVRTFVNDDASTLTRCHTADISETLFGRKEENKVVSKRFFFYFILGSKIKAIPVQ